MQAALNGDTLSSQINERFHHHTDTGEISAHRLTGVELKTSNTSCYFKVHPLSFSSAWIQSVGDKLFSVCVELGGLISGLLTHGDQHRC